MVDAKKFIVILGVCLIFIFIPQLSYAEEDVNADDLNEIIDQFYNHNNVVSSSASFSEGDVVRTTDVMNLRWGPSTSYSVRTTLSANTYAEIKSNNNNGTYADGFYWWYVEVLDDGQRGWVAATSRLEIAPPPDSPSLVRPADRDLNVSTRPTFEWQTVPDAEKYSILLVANYFDNDYILLEDVNTPYTLPLRYELKEGEAHAWTVIASNKAGNSENNDTRTFATKEKAEPAYFAVEIVDYDSIVEAGESTYIYGEVINTGGQEGTQNIFFEFGLKDYKEKNVTLSEGEKKQVSFRINTDANYKGLHGIVLGSNDDEHVIDHAVEVVEVKDDPEEYTITLSSDPRDGGRVQGGGTYQEGKRITISATAEEGYVFENWTEDEREVHSEENYRFTVTKDRNLVANFREETTETKEGFLTLPFKDPDIKVGWIFDRLSSPPHLGIDFFKEDRHNNWINFEVVAAADGVAYWDESRPEAETGEWGKYVYIKHEGKGSGGSDYYTLYAHLESVNPDIPRYGEGTVSINRGDPVGIAGDTGATTSPIHLHFEVHESLMANQVDPYDLYDPETRESGHRDKIHSQYRATSVVGGSNHLWSTNPPELPDVKDEEPEKAPKIDSVNPEEPKVRSYRQRFSIVGSNFEEGLEVRLVDPGGNAYTVPRFGNAYIDVATDKININAGFQVSGKWVVQVINNPGLNELKSEEYEFQVVSDEGVASAITARIGGDLLNLIDQHLEADSPYHFSDYDGDFNLDQYKALITTIAHSEGGHLGYLAHCSAGRTYNHPTIGNGRDTFEHADSLLNLNDFHFSTGIGPFQVDRGQSHRIKRGWDSLFTIEKLDVEKSLKSTLEWHHNTFSNNQYTFAEIAGIVGNTWFGIGSEEKLSDNWEAVTGTTWANRNKVGDTIKWEDISEELAARAASLSSYQWNDGPEGIVFQGHRSWNMGENYNLEGELPTYHITAHSYAANTFSYYYTYCEQEMKEAWVYDDKELNKVFVRDLEKESYYERAEPYDAQLRFYPNNHQAGRTLSGPAFVMPDNTSMLENEINEKGYSVYRKNMDVFSEQETEALTQDDKNLEGTVQLGYTSLASSPLCFGVAGGDSTITLKVYRPDGSLYDEQTGSGEPVIIEVPQDEAETGAWSYKVTRDNELSLKSTDPVSAMVGNANLLVKSVTPEAQETNVAIDEPLIIEFDRPIEKEDLKDITLESRGGFVDIQPKVDNNKLYINFYGELFYDTTYTLIIPSGSIKSSEINKQGRNEQIVYSFSTEEEPQPDTAIDRLAGGDRYKTAVEVGRALYAEDGSAEAVVLARGDAFADALAGVPLAHVKNAPLLLTDTDELTGSTAEEIARAMGNTGTVYILGGNAAVSENVETTLQDKGYLVERLAGGNRYETAVAIAEELTGNPDKVFLATGEGFADAVAASSAAAIKGAPILLTGADELSEPAAAYLAGHRALLNDIYVLGGTAVISNAVYGEAGASARISGTDRWKTATAIAEEFFTNPAEITLATGNDYPDALSGGVYAAARQAPVILTDSSNLSDAAANYVQAEKEAVGIVSVFGGEAAVEDKVLDQLKGILE